MKYSLCIEPIFTDYPIYERFAIAKEFGLDAVEFWNPASYEISKLEKAANSSGLPVATMTLVDGWGVSLSDDYADIVKNVERSIQIGKDLGCNYFIGLSGNTSSEITSQQDVISDNLKRLCELLDKHDSVIVLEALNTTVDHKGYFLDSSKVGFDIIKNVNSPNVRLLYDIYHMQIMGDDVIQTITENIDYIGHFHSAGVPGRHELRSGDLDYTGIISCIKDTGYNKYFGLEYMPQGDHMESARSTMEYLKTLG